MPERILVADDEAPTRELLRLYLGRAGYAVDEAADGLTALRLLQERDYDLVVLDRLMPGLDGAEVCRRLRAAGARTGVLMLTALGEVQDRLEGLEVGADDYLPKPYDPREVVARVQAILRRTGARADEPGTRLSRGELVIFPARREVTWRGRPLTLTPKEFDLLLHLARHPGRVFSRDQLLEQIWGYDYEGDTRTVDSHVKNLREKLGPDGKALVVTVWGLGYKLETPPPGGQRQS